MDASWDRLLESTLENLKDVGLKLLAGLALWLVGRWLVSMALRLATRALEGRQVDVTLARYLVSSLAVLLNVVLVAAILGFFGVETTSFAALLAAAGLAIGTAWGGLLANFAAGAFLVVLRPFKVGDMVSAGGVTGVVREVGLFATAIDTPDGVRIIVGNNKIFGDNIANYDQNADRRVDLVAQLAHDADVPRAIAALREALAKIPNQTRAPDVRVLEFSSLGPVLAVRPFTANSNYWQVYFDAHDSVIATLGALGLPTPRTRVAVIER